MSALDVLQQRAAEATRQAERLTKMVELAHELGEEGLSELVALIGPAEQGHANGNGNGDGHGPDPAVPRGREAVRRIVGERPGIWTLMELRAEMERRGWFTS